MRRDSSDSNCRWRRARSAASFSAAQQAEFGIDERGAILDFIDHPLNNRWWYEDQFAEIRTLNSDAEKLARLKVLYTWENPGPGSFYDDICNVAQSEHVLRGGDDCVVTLLGWLRRIQANIEAGIVVDCAIVEAGRGRRPLGWRSAR